MKTRWFFVGRTAILMALALLLALAVGLAQAQEPGPEGEMGVQGEAGVLAITPGAIAIQGRLTDTGGNPLPDGNYNVTFRLYESETGGSPICSDTNTVAVADGLFNSYIYFARSQIFIFHAQRMKVCAR